MTVQKHALLFSESVAILGAESDLSQVVTAPLNLHQPHAQP